MLLRRGEPVTDQWLYLPEGPDLEHVGRQVRVEVGDATHAYAIEGELNGIKYSQRGGYINGLPDLLVGHWYVEENP
jgi:hypothetical protein